MAKRFVLTIIRFYQRYLSFLWGRHCRFYPSCSDYFLQAIGEYGLIYGTYKGILRILRCQPFSPGGFDPLTK